MLERCTNPQTGAYVGTITLQPRTQWLHYHDDASRSDPDAIQYLAVTPDGRGRDTYMTAKAARGWLIDQALLDDAREMQSRRDAALLAQNTKH